MDEWIQNLSFHLPVKIKMNGDFFEILQMLILIDLWPTSSQFWLYMSMAKILYLCNPYMPSRLNLSIVDK